MFILHAYRNADTVINVAKSMKGNGPDKPYISYTKVSYSSPQKMWDENQDKVSAMGMLVTAAKKLTICPRHLTFSWVVEYRDDENHVHTDPAVHVHGVVGVEVETYHDFNDPSHLNTPYPLPFKKLESRVKGTVDAIITDTASLTEVMRITCKYVLLGKASFTYDCLCTDDSSRKGKEAMLAGASGGMSVAEIINSRPDTRDLSVRMLNAMSLKQGIKGQSIAQMIYDETSGVKGWFASHNMKVPPKSFGEIFSEHYASTAFSPPKSYQAGAANTTYAEAAKKLTELMPDLKLECVCPTGCGMKSSYFGLIQHLNDDHKWPREKVAKWLAEEAELRELNFNFPTPDSIKKSGKPTLE